eukprot:TRINITY_DN4399_c0_g1_i1.p1 TRINITY_DN4399_c0_g1~~TRINITY_DN4399_c0_g1_i1.p1  ORF type:complete len:265 (-),score=37.82 TRINITY_DN4399_c0_g1_i1:31-801(-)
MPYLKFALLGVLTSFSALASDSENLPVIFGCPACEAVVSEIAQAEPDQKTAELCARVAAEFRLVEDASTGALQFTKKSPQQLALTRKYGLTRHAEVAAEDGELGKAGLISWCQEFFQQYPATISQCLSQQQCQELLCVDAARVCQPPRERKPRTLTREEIRSRVQKCGDEKADCLLARTPDSYLKIDIPDLATIGARDLNLFLPSWFGPAPRFRRFLWNGKPLDDDEDLHSLGVAIGDTVHIEDVRTTPSLKKDEL